MTKSEYKRIRQLIRENGRYGLCWIECMFGTKVYEEY